MPCSGPSQELAYKQADKFYEKVMTMLEKEHGVTEPDKYWGTMNADHKKAKKELKKALRELIWTEACSSW